MDQIWLLGDSLTQGGFEIEYSGFAARLAHVYNRKLDVINRGLSGYNTTWAIPVLEGLWPLSSTSHPKIPLLAIWFGANDASFKVQHVPIPEFKANLMKMVNMVRDTQSEHYSPDTNVILVTPPPVNTYQRNADLGSRTPPLDPDRSFEQTQAYAEAVRETAAALSIPVADVFAAVWSAAGEEEPALDKYLSDGLHLTGAGYDIVYKVLLDTIKTHYPRLDPAAMRSVYAPWSEINFEHPEKSLKARSPFP